MSRKTQDKTRSTNHTRGRGHCKAEATMGSSRLVNASLVLSTEKKSALRLGLLRTLVVYGTFPLRARTLCRHRDAEAKEKRATPTSTASTTTVGETRRPPAPAAANTPCAVSPPWKAASHRRRRSCRKARRCPTTRCGIPGGEWQNIGTVSSGTGSRTTQSDTECGRFTASQTPKNR